MMLDKREDELRAIIDNWTEPYFKGEIYGFGMSDELGFATFFEDDLGEHLLSEGKHENLHEKGFRASTYRTGARVGRGFRVKAVFDNNPLIQNTIRNGYKILSPEKIPALGKIKIAVFPRRYHEIKKQLESYGLKEFEDFLYYNFFVALYNYFVQNKVLLWKVTIGVTAKCTLRCRDCNMFMPHYISPSDIAYDTLSTDLDALFQRVDNVQWFGILGGEPLLYKELYKYIKKLGNYSDRIGELLIDTNGSVFPDDNLIKLAKDMGNVRFMINNYEIDDKYIKKVNRTVEKIKAGGVSYTLRNYDWSKYRRSFRIDDDNALRAHYIRCNQPFTAFQDKRFYTCHLPWSATRCGIGVNDPNDYIDFTNPFVTDLDIVKAGLGHLPRGYTSNCAMCNGCDPEFYEKIPKAVQI